MGHNGLEANAGHTVTAAGSPDGRYFPEKQVDIREAWIPPISGRHIAPADKLSELLHLTVQMDVVISVTIHAISTFCYHSVESNKSLLFPGYPVPAILPQHAE